MVPLTPCSLFRKLGYESQVLGVRGGREALSSLLKSSGGNRWSLLNAGEDRAEVSRLRGSEQGKRRYKDTKLILQSLR